MELETEKVGECSQSTALSSVAATPNQPRQKKKVMIDEEPQSHDQASLVLKDSSPADLKPKRPVLDEPVIVLLGREVLFAIGVFFLLALVVSLVVIQLTTLTKNRTLGEKEMSCQAESNRRKSTVDGLQNDLKREQIRIRQSESINRDLSVRLDRVTCSQPSCLWAAVDLLDKIDYDSGPCEDFWRYACGHWLDETEIPDSREAWGPDSEAEKQFALKVIADLKNDTLRSENSTAERKYKTLFQICMGEAKAKELSFIGDNDDDEDGDDETGDAYDPIGRILSRWTTCLNATPHHNTRPPKENESLSSSALDGDCRRKRQKILEELLLTYSIDVIVRLTVVRNSETSSQMINIIKIDHGGLSLPERSHYRKESINHSNSAYRKYISDTMKWVWKKEVSNAVIQQFAKSVINVEKQIAQITDDAEETSKDGDLRNLGTTITVGKLQEISPEVDWLSLVQGLSNWTSNETEVVVSSEKYMSNISNLLSNITNSDLHNYFIWRLVYGLAPFVSTSKKSEQVAFLNARKGKQTKHMNGLSRQRYCQEAVMEGFPHAVASSVVLREDNMELILNNVTEMVVSIKEMLLDSIQSADWMDNQTSAEAQAKLQDMRISIAFPDFVLNETELDRFYSSFVVNERESFFENILNGLKHRTEMLRLRLEHPGDIYDEEWEVNPLQPKVFYSPLANTLGVTASLLQKPFYDQNRYVYINYGSLGTMVAHEMMSVVIDLESQSLVPGWWTDDTSTNFINRTQCLRDNYSQRYVQGIGRLTFGEHFSDISGLIYSYQAYKRWEKQNGVEPLLPGLNLTNDQVFFVAFAQNLCKVRRNRMDKRKRFVMTDRSPAEEFRVRGSLSLSKEFYKEFKCELSIANNGTSAPQCGRIPW